MDDDVEYPGSEVFGERGSVFELVFSGRPTSAEWKLASLFFFHDHHSTMVLPPVNQQPALVAIEMYVPNEATLLRMAQEDMRRRLEDIEFMSDDERQRQLTRSKMRMLTYCASHAERDCALWRRIHEQTKARMLEMDVRYGPASEFSEQVKEDYWRRHREEDKALCVTFAARTADCQAAFGKLREMHDTIGKELPGRKKKKQRKEILRLDLTLEEEQNLSRVRDRSDDEVPN